MLFSSGLCVATPAEQAVTRNASEHYLALDTAGRYDELLKVYTPDAVFLTQPVMSFKVPSAMAR